MRVALGLLVLFLGWYLSGFNKKASPSHELKSRVGLLVRRVRDAIRLCFEPVAPENVELLTRAEVEEKYSPETWQRQAYDGVSNIVQGNDGLPKFPCIYATKGLRHNEHRWLFMPSCDASGPRNVHLAAAAMREYLPVSRQIGPNTSLVIVFPPEEQEKDVAYYQSSFWSFLRGLRTVDEKPWPQDVPGATESPNWTFCFEGQPAFMAAMTPAHEKRASRHAPNFTIAVQPRWVFDELFATPEKRQKAVETVRNLMPAFDSISPSPDLSQYGQAGTTESHQFYLLDENETAHCPFSDMDG